MDRSIQSSSNCRHPFVGNILLCHDTLEFYACKLVESKVKGRIKGKIKSAHAMITYLMMKLWHV